MPSRLDLIGNIYDELTVVEMLYNYNNKHRTYCKCTTIDGDEVIVRADALQSGATHRAKGAGRIKGSIDITMQRFGLLQAIEPTGNKSPNGSIIWRCICDCGNYTEVPLGQLTRKHTLSCGCRHQSKWEMFIKDFLVSLDVEFIQQKRFYDCTNKKGTDTLPVYVEKHKTV